MELGGGGLCRTGVGVTFLFIVVSNPSGLREAGPHSGETPGHLCRVPGTYLLLRLQPGWTERAPCDSMSHCWLSLRGWVAKVT